MYVLLFLVKWIQGCCLRFLLQSFWDKNNEISHGPQELRNKCQNGYIENDGEQVQKPCQVFEGWGTNDAWALAISLHVWSFLLISSILIFLHNSFISLRFHSVFFISSNVYWFRFISFHFGSFLCRSICFLLHVWSFLLISFRFISIFLFTRSRFASCLHFHLLVSCYMFVSLSSFPIGPLTSVHFIYFLRFAYNYVSQFFSCFCSECEKIFRSTIKPIKTHSF